MARLPAKVLFVDRLADQYLITVKVCETVDAHSINSISEKISRTSAPIAMVGLILPIIKIPTLRQGSRSRCGRFSKPRNFGRLLSLQPYQALRVQTKRNG